MRTSILEPIGRISLHSVGNRPMPLTHAMPSYAQPSACERMEIKLEEVLEALRQAQASPTPPEPVGGQQTGAPVAHVLVKEAGMEFMRVIITVVATAVGTYFAQQMITHAFGGSTEEKPKPK